MTETIYNVINKNVLINCGVVEVIDIDIDIDILCYNF